MGATQICRSRRNSWAFTRLWKGCGKLGEPSKPSQDHIRSHRPQGPSHKGRKNVAQVKAWRSAGRLSLGRWSGATHQVRSACSATCTFHNLTFHFLHAILNGIAFQAFQWKYCCEMIRMSDNLQFQKLCLDFFLTMLTSQDQTNSLFTYRNRPIMKMLHRRWSSDILIMQLAGNWVIVAETIVDF